MKEAETIFAVVNYNESKVENSAACLVEAANMDFTGPDGVEQTFLRRERMAFRARKKSFHLVLSPGDGEEWDDAKIRLYTAKMLDELGFSGQPYVVYRHEDTLHPHWHVVMTKIKDDGRAVDTFHSWERTREAAIRLGPEFGYEYARHAAPRVNRFGVTQFCPDVRDKKGLLLKLFNDALEYRFTTYDQFVQIMRVMGVSVRERTGFHTKLVLQGLDEKGRPCTGEFTEKDFGVSLYELYSRRARECHRTYAQWKGNRDRVTEWCAVPLRESVSMRQMRRFARAGKIDFTLRRDPSSHRISGGDFIDHETKCAFSLSDFDRGSGLGLDSVRDADEKRWDHREDSEPEEHVTLGDLLAGLSQGTSKSREKDPKDDRRRRRRKGMRI